MCKFSCQITIICKKKNSCCCLIKPSNRINSFRTAFTDKLKYCMLSMRIFNSRNIIFWLIHKDIYLLFSRKSFILISDIIIISDFCSKISYQFPINSYKSVFNMFISIPS